MEHLKEISQKPHMCPFGADSLKRIFPVSFTKYLQMILPSAASVKISEK